MNPQLLLLITGKRKSGKDYLTYKLSGRLGEERCAIIKTYNPIKLDFAQMHNLDYTRLLDASEYKERYRRDMIVWSDALRDKDPGYFCRRGIQMVPDADRKPLWIAADIRNKTDLVFFRQLCEESGGAVMWKVRVVATEVTRGRRGWVYTQGVDDVASECDLDDVTDWDHVVTNNGDADDDVELFIDKVVDFFK